MPTPANRAKIQLVRGSYSNIAASLSDLVDGELCYAKDENRLYMVEGSTLTQIEADPEDIESLIASIIAGGTGIDVTHDDSSDTVTIDLADTAVTAGSYGSASSIPTFTVDQQGRITAASENAINTDVVLIQVHNQTASDIVKGKPVYVSGTHSSGKPTVALADNDGSNTYPAIGLVYETITTGTDGYVIISGLLTNIATNTLGNAGDPVYIDSTPGDLTTTRPTASTEKVQKVGLITRSHASNGTILIIGAGRTNDINNELVALTGVALNDSDLGTFTGTTITDNSSIKTALQELETKTETPIDTADIVDDAVTADKLADTSVTAGSYTAVDITVDAQGRITAASSNTIPTNNNQLTNGAGYITGYTVTESDVTNHQAALSITESQISDLGSYATISYVDAEVAGLVDSAPGTLDTLNELAAALGDDANFSTTVTNSIASKLPLAGGQMTGNITFSGTQTVDGRDLSVDGAKLDGIAAGAEVNTVDSVNAQTGAVVLDADDIDDTSTTNKFTTAADITKLAGIEAGATADQNASEVSYDNTTSGMTATDLQDAVDELDNRLDNSSSSGTSGPVFWSRSGTTVSPINSGDDVSINGDISITGTVDGRDVSADGTKLDGIESGATADQTAAEIKTAYESNTNTNAFTDAEKTKLSGIAAGAEVNVDTNLGVTTTTTTNTITSSTGTNATLNEATGSAAGLMSTAHHNKLDGIESGATADQTASEILTAIKTVDGTGSGLDADLLDGQQGSYYLNTSTTFGGDVSGTYNAIVVADDSHNHIISNVDGLQTALDGKLSTTGKAADSNLLDGIDSGSFLRSDAADSFTSLSGTSITIGSGVVLSESSDRADLLQISSNTSNWGGIQIRNSSNEGRWSFMVNGSNAGIYDDENNKWHLYLTENGATELRHAGTACFKTTGSSSATIGGSTVWHAGNDGSGSGLDADLLDGQQGSYYLNTSSTIDGGTY